jgi:hypothetical protein
LVSFNPVCGQNTRNALKRYLPGPIPKPETGFISIPQKPEIALLTAGNSKIGGKSISFNQV